MNAAHVSFFSKTIEKKHIIMMILIRQNSRENVKYQIEKASVAVSNFAG
jgi:hypothetical protein